MDEHKDVPYIVYESESARHERTVKRLLTTLLITILLMVGTNLAWLYVWNQYDITSETVTIENEGDAKDSNLIGAGAVSDVWVNGVSVLDEDIAKVVTLQNLVDGSATGSIRGVGTREEGSSYTIGEYAFVEGDYTRAIGNASHAEGGNTLARAHYSHAEGSSTTAAGFASHAEGYYSYTGKAYAHAEGNGSAEGEYSHSEGLQTQALGESSHSEGHGVKAFGDSSHAEGCQGYRNTMQEITKVRDYYYSYTTASPYLIAGNKFLNWLPGQTDASRYLTIESVDTSNREIYISNAEFNEAFTIGRTESFSLVYCGAFGSYSHSEGYDALAIGENSHAQNLATIALQPNQTALGKYNIADEDGDHAVIVGNGTDASNCSNALTVGWDGSVNIAAGASYKINGVPINTGLKVISAVPLEIISVGTASGGVAVLRDNLGLLGDSVGRIFALDVNSAGPTVANRQLVYPLYTTANTISVAGPIADSLRWVAGEDTSVDVLYI